MTIDCLTGTRHRVDYRHENCYLTLTNKSLDISMVSHDSQDETLTGLDIIGALVTLLLEEDVDAEVISGRIWETSRKQNDLADHLSMLLIK